MYPIFWIFLTNEELSNKYFLFKILFVSYSIYYYFSYVNSVSPQQCFFSSQYLETARKISYHHLDKNKRQNKCYPHAGKINVTPKGAYLPISKLHSILAVANLLAHNNKSQLWYCGQISLQSAAVNCSFLKICHLWGNTYFAGDSTW